MSSSGIAICFPGRIRRYAKGHMNEGGGVAYLDLHERLALHDALRALPQRGRRQGLPAGGRPLLDALPCSDRLILGRLLLLRMTARPVDSDEPSGRAAQLTGTKEQRQQEAAPLQIMMSEQRPPTFRTEMAPTAQ